MIDKPGTPFDKTFTTAQLMAIIAKRIADLYESGELTEHSKGFTYIIGLSNGFIKIGYSTRLASRLHRLSLKYGEVVYLLAVLPGGYTQEQCLHHRFRDYRQWVMGEMFNPSSELMQFAHDSGFCPESRDELTKFETWARNVGLNGCSSKYRGVSWDKSAVRWKAQTKINGKETLIGHFDDETEAAKAYDAYVIEHNLKRRPTNASLGLFDMEIAS